MIGVTLEKLKYLPGRLCVAGGRNRIASLQAALKGGNADAARRMRG